MSQINNKIRQTLLLMKKQKTMQIINRKNINSHRENLNKKKSN